MFNVVLHNPEIPNNTGNIGRTCIATGSSLHLVHPLGFSTDEKACRRAGLDYWPRLNPTEHENWNAYLDANKHAVENHRLWFFTTKAARSLWDADIQPGDHLVFGKESSGLPPDILSQHPQRTVVLPMIRGERSLNLSTAVCAAVYEGLRRAAQAGIINLDNNHRFTRPNTTTTATPSPAENTPQIPTGSPHPHNQHHFSPQQQDEQRLHT